MRVFTDIEGKFDYTLFQKNCDVARMRGVNTVLRWIHDMLLVGVDRYLMTKATRELCFCEVFCLSE